MLFIKSSTLSQGQEVQINLEGNVMPSYKKSISCEKVMISKIEDKLLKSLLQLVFASYQFLQTVYQVTDKNNISLPMGFYDTYFESSFMAFLLRTNKQNFFSGFSTSDIIGNIVNFIQKLLPTITFSQFAKEIPTISFQFTDIKDLSLRIQTDFMLYHSFNIIYFTLQVYQQLNNQSSNNMKMIKKSQDLIEQKFAELYHEIYQTSKEKNLIHDTFLFMLIKSIFPNLPITDKKVKSENIDQVIQACLSTKFKTSYQLLLYKCCVERRLIAQIIFILMVGGLISYLLRSKFHKSK